MQNVYLAIVLGPARRRRGGRPVRQGDRPRRRAHGHDLGRRDLVRAVGLRARRAAPRRADLQRRALRVGGGRRSVVRGRVPDRSPDRADDGRRDVRVARRARLHDRLHARRPGLPALLQLHLAVHVLDADARDEQQLPPALLRLGGGRRRLVPLDRLLVHAADRDFREPEGVPREPGRRLRFPVGNCGARDLHRHAELLAHVRAGGASRGNEHRDLLGRALVVAHVRVHLSLRRRDAPSPLRCRCTSGCPIRWRARRRSPR